MELCRVCRTGSCVLLVYANGMAAVCGACVQDVVEMMSPNYTLGAHRDEEFSDNWTTSDPLAYFDGF